MVRGLQSTGREAPAGALRPTLCGEAPIRALRLALGCASAIGSSGLTLRCTAAVRSSPILELGFTVAVRSSRLELGGAAAVGALILALGGESSLSLAHWRAFYVGLDRLRSWIGYVGLDWAFHITSFCITNWSTFYVASLNWAWGFTWHVGNRLARNLALNTGRLRLAWNLGCHLGGVRLAWSLALHLRGLRFACSLALHLGGLRLARSLACHLCGLGLARSLASQLGNLNWAWCRALHDLHHLALGTRSLGGAEGPLDTALGKAILNLLLVTHGPDAGG